MGPTAQQDNPFLRVQQIVSFVTVRLYGSTELAEELQDHPTCTGAIIIIEKLTSGHNAAHKPDVSFYRLVFLVMYDRDCSLVRLYQYFGKFLPKN